MKEQLVPLLVHVPRSLRKALKARAVAEDQTLGKSVIEALLVSLSQSGD